MSAKRPNKRRPSGQHSANRSKSSGADVTVRKLASGGWVLVHPRAARDRAEDLEEVRLMIDAGEFDVAVDELRWLLSGCSELMAAHVMLGELAIEMGPDPPLARGHFGYAWQMGEKALRRAKVAGPLPADQLANRPLHEAARGLTWCLEKLDKSPMADEIAARVQQLDKNDPLGVAALLDEMRSGGLPVVGLGP